MPETLQRVVHPPMLPPRPLDAHKGDFGRILVVGGNIGMVGAPALTATAALRAGAGLVKIACPQPAQQAIASLCPCATSCPLPAENGMIGWGAIGQLCQLAADHDVLAVGPGLGNPPAMSDIVRPLLAAGRTAIVLDADALNALAPIDAWWSIANQNLVVTPHPGEMRRLLDGADIPIDVTRRSQAAAALARKIGGVVVQIGRAHV